MKPGEVFRLYSEIAGKPKYHLCISIAGGFLFINSPKPKTYAGDLVVDASHLPFLPPTPSGKSVISCSTIVSISERELHRRKATLLGVAPRSVLLKIFDVVSEAEFLSEEERELILGGLEDWV